MGTEELKLHQCWNSFRSSLHQIIPESEIDAWLKSLVLKECTAERITFGGLNKFFSDHVCQKYPDTFRKLIRRHFGPQFPLAEDFKIFFVLSKQKATTTRKKVTGNIRSNTGLNSNYSLKRFINGVNTDIAYAATLAVIDNISDPKYNPLFLYGPVGLGKTHLMQGIGLKVLEDYPNKNIWYCSAEGFTNNLIEGIRFKQTHKLREKYRSLDLLMIDDIQFLENKFSTQEEFFHTLNELILNNKQVVITADRHPREIKSVEERLISRFSAGMVAKIERPDFKTRCEIIKNELSQTQLDLSKEALEHIAKRIKSNVRDIKGVLTKLEAENSLLGLDISLDVVQMILKEALAIDKNQLSVDELIRIVAEHMNVKYRDVVSEKRARSVSNVRQIAMFIVREITNFSYPVIGRYFNKNHTSVIQACRRVKKNIEKCTETRQLVQVLIRKIETA